jgi:hypothetical protein
MRKEAVDPIAKIAQSLGKYRIMSGFQMTLILVGRKPVSRAWCLPL